MNRLIFSNDDNVSIRNDDFGVLPVIPVLIGLLAAMGFAVVSWMFFAQVWIATLIFIVTFMLVWLMVKGLEARVIGKKGFALGFVAIIIMVILAVTVAPVMFEINPPPDLNGLKTKQYTVGNWEGKGTFTDNGEPHEILHHSFYVAAWTGEDDSEEIHIQGKICYTDWYTVNFNPDTDDVKYRIYLTSGGSWGDWVYEEKVDVFGESGDCAIYEEIVYTIQGSFDGWIKVELRAWFHGVSGPSGWQLMAYDCAEIESGKGDINFVEGIYEVGEPARLKLDLGYAKGQYKLEVEALTTGEMLYDNFIDESDEGKITYMEFMVKPSHFATGSWPDCPENLIEARLWNELFPKSQHETAVTDIKTLSPPIPDIKLSKPDDGIAYRTGETIIITVEGDPSLETGIEVKEYRLHISPGDIVDENTDGEFTFQPPHRGTYKLIYSCQDAVCRRSEVGTKEIHVYDKGEEIPTSEFFWWPIVVAILAATLIAAIMIGLDYSAHKKITKKGMIIGTVAFIAVLLFLLWLMELI